MKRRNFLTIAAASGLYATSGFRASAQTSILSLTGDLASGARSFSDQDLLDLPQVSFETSTLWTEGVLEFSGPSLKSVLEASGAGQGNIVMTAVNDYSVEMPQDIVSDELPIIANRINGEPFSVRDKGPLWVVFPYDSDTELQQELIYSYSIWQLNRIEVLG